MRKLYTIYRNPEAKRALIYLLISATAIGLCLLISIAWLESHIAITVNQKQLQLYALQRVGEDGTSFLKGQPLSMLAQQEFQKLLHQQIASQISVVDLSVLKYWALAMWCTIIVLSFVTMTVYFNKFYRHLHVLEQFIQNLATQQDTIPFDIRQNTEGELSILRSHLHTVATTLHTQRRLAMQHKNYLTKNIADISHQLKTPLTSLMVVSDTLKLLPLEQRTDDKIEQLDTQIQRIEYLVQSLLLLARLDAGVLHISKQTVNAQQFMSDILERVTILCQHKHIQLITPPIFTGHLYIDTFYFGEAVTNVLKNAIDHTSAYQAITITLEHNIFYSTLSIHNEGQPIGKSDLPYIFERFYRGKHATSTGVGIGLSLANELCQHHSGKLTAENTKNGVLMTFTIPVQ